jgi:iron complex transport system substrate-binding protein
MGREAALGGLNIFVFCVMSLGALLVSSAPPHVLQGEKFPAASEEARWNSAIPARRAVVYPLVLDAYLTLDKGAGHIIGASRPALEWAARAGLRQIFPETAQISPIGYSLNPENAEAVLLLQPDAVFSWPLFAEPLRQAGVRTLVEVPAGIERERDVWRIIGQKSATSARSESLLNRQENKLEDIRDAIPCCAATARKFVIFGGGVSSMYIAGQEYFLRKKLTYLGFTKAPSKRSRLDIERLLLIDPDILFLDGLLNDYGPRQLYKDGSPWLSLRAVREHRVYKMLRHSLSNGPVYDPILLKWMAELFCECELGGSMREDIRDMFMRVYQMQISEEEIDRYLLIDDNGLSVFYHKFVIDSGLSKIRN